MQAIQELREKGFTFSLEGRDGIRFTYTRSDDPDPQAVVPLLKEVKAHKQEAIVYLRDETIDRAFRQALAEIQDQYIPGLLDHTQRHPPDIWQVIERAEDNLEGAWLAVRDGSLPIKDFEEVVRAWKDAYLLTVQEHKAMRFDSQSEQNPEPDPKTLLWDPEMQELVAWFCECPLPSEPFELGQGLHVTDPEHFYTALWQDIVRGPTGPRATMGALKTDLAALRDLALRTQGLRENHLH